MKAWVLCGKGDLRLEEAPMPHPKEGEVLVNIKFAGICASDIPRVFDGEFRYPLTLGHEFSGVTEDGRRVGAFPLLPCHRCEACRGGHYETCADYSYIGSRVNGAFAEYVAVPEWNLIEIPSEMSLEHAALFEPAAVALHAVGRMEQLSSNIMTNVVKTSITTSGFATADGVPTVSGDMARAAIVGNGPIGRLIRAWLTLRGVNADIFGRSDRENCGHYSDFGDAQSYDACFEAVGTPDSFARCVELAKPNGTIILVGNPEAGFRVERDIYWKILRKQLHVHGSWNSSWRKDWECVLEHAKTLDLGGFISHRYAFGQLGEALEMIRDKREKHEKVLLIM